MQTLLIMKFLPCNYTYFLKDGQDVWYRTDDDHYTRLMSVKERSPHGIHDIEAVRASEGRDVIPAITNCTNGCRCV